MTAAQQRRINQTDCQIMFWTMEQWEAKLSESPTLTPDDAALLKDDLALMLETFKRLSDGIKA